MRFATIISLVVIGVVSRLMPHWPNFTPVLAAALFAGVHFKDKKWAFAVPLATMIISDLFLPYHSTMFFNYGAIALVVFVGTLITKVKFTSILGASLLGTVLFFLITNFGSWAIDPYNMYANDFSGLMASYVAAIPFAGNSLLADLSFNAIFFGGFALAQSKIPQLQAVKA